MKRWLIGLLLLFLCLLLSGCGQEDSIVGTWQEDYFDKTCPAKDDMQNHIIVFNDDGTFMNTVGLQEDGHFRVISFEDSYGSYAGALKLSRVAEREDDPLFRMDDLAPSFYSQDSGQKTEKAATPVLTAPPGKFDEGLSMKKHLEMRKNRSFYYSLIGNKLFIINARVDLEKGSQISGKYHFVR